MSQQTHNHIMSMGWKNIEISHAYIEHTISFHLRFAYKIRYFLYWFCTWNEKRAITIAHSVFSFGVVFLFSFALFCINKKNSLNKFCSDCGLAAAQYTV